jgi:excisionase family DNA binding protein
MDQINEMNYLDMEKLSKYLYLSKSTIYKMVCNKTIPYVKLGTRTLFVKDQIEKWVISGGQMSIVLPNLSKI